MKLRHPLAIKAAGFGAAVTLRLWMGTLRFRYRPLGPSILPDKPGGPGGRFVYALWHENILYTAHRFGRPDAYALISQHADGKLIAEACRHLRTHVVAGSTTRGGVEAVKRLVGLERKGVEFNLAITPDGPRGPRRRVQPGAVYLAGRMGMPVVVSAFGYQLAWRLKSWDRLAMPCPWSAVTCVTGEPIEVPPDLDRAGLEEYRGRIERALELATTTAEGLAARETW